MQHRRLADIIGSPTAISPNLGLRAFDFVQGVFQEGEAISIDFEGIESLTTAFCNAFIGKLYMSFDPELLDRNVQVIGIDPSDVWAKKIKNAILLGRNENLRTIHRDNLAEVIFS